MKENGEIVTDYEQVQQEAVKLYSNLFTENMKWNEQK